VTASAAVVRRRGDPLPIYPAVFLAAWMVGLLSDSAASVHALPRPLLVGILLVVGLQAGVTLIARNRHLAAVIVFLGELVLIGFGIAAVLVVVLLLGALAVALRQARSVRRAPWRILTSGLNLVTAILLVLVVTTGLVAGTLTPPERLTATTRGAAQPGLPDIYLVLLDGHPRSDTELRDFGYDDTGFRTRMEGLGFDVASDSHSNYNGTELTLSSMLNVTQVPDLPDVVKHRPHTPQGQVRALTTAINQGTALDTLRGLGYEIVTVPSSVSSPTLYGADRIIDGGQMSSFELEIFREGYLPNILPVVQRRLFIGQHRDRINNTFDRLGGLAAERTDHPRFVLAHLLTPHAPVAFGPAGEPRYGWPCFPTDCSMFDGGQIYGDAVLAPFREQFQYLDGRVEGVAREMLAHSERPPVVIFFSDHGSRHDFDDQDEMIRSFFVAATPGRPGLFPDDVTPINVIPRLLNAYAGTDLPMASEESYLVDMRTVHTSGMLNLIPWSLPAR
jgi:hypothetical protein